MSKLKETNCLEKIDFYHKVILDLSLKNFSKFVIKSEKISTHYIENSESYNQIFREGIMSQNKISR